MLEDNPNDSFLKHALALEHIKIGNDEIAKKLFDEILNTEPNYVGSYYHLAKLQERNNNIEDAIKTYKKGIEIAKQNNEKHLLNELINALEDLED